MLIQILTLLVLLDNGMIAYDSNGMNLLAWARGYRQHK